MAQLTMEELFDICRLLLEDEGYEVRRNPFNANMINIERTSGSLGMFTVVQDSEDLDVVEVQCLCLAMPSTRGLLDSFCEAVKDIKAHTCHPFGG